MFSTRPPLSLLAVQLVLEMAKCGPASSPPVTVREPQPKQSAPDVGCLRSGHSQPPNRALLTSSAPSWRLMLEHVLSVKNFPLPSPTGITHHPYACLTATPTSFVGRGGHLSHIDHVAVFPCAGDLSLDDLPLPSARGSTRHPRVLCLGLPWLAPVPSSEQLVGVVRPPRLACHPALREPQRFRVP